MLCQRSPDFYEEGAQTTAPLFLPNRLIKARLAMLTSVEKPDAGQRFSIFDAICAYEEQPRRWDYKRSYGAWDAGEGARQRTKRSP